MLESFECEGSNFEDDPFFDRQPVKFLESRSYVMLPFHQWRSYIGAIGATAPLGNLGKKIFFGNTAT